jgi:hypothetical protein
MHCASAFGIITKASAKVTTTGPDLKNLVFMCFLLSRDFAGNAKSNRDWRWKAMKRR